MFGFSLSEIALIGTIAVLVVDPKDLPAIARTCHKWWCELRSVTDEIKAGMHEIIQEAGIDDIKNELSQDSVHMTEKPKYIKDADGNFQRVYDISELMKEKESSFPESPKAILGESRKMDGPRVAGNSGHDENE